MFERFTETAQQVIVLAQEEAVSFRHRYIGTEHLLLGLLLAEDGDAARVLDGLGVSLLHARERVVSYVGWGEEGPADQMPFTPRAKKVLELALRESIRLGHSHIGTEHLLLGLAREGEGVANHVLSEFGADSERIRDAVLRRVGTPEEQRQSATAQVLARGPSDRAGGAGALAWFEVGALLDGAGPALRALLGEIEERLGRPADAGDLLVMLASVPDGLATSALAALGIDADGLARGVAEARNAGVQSSLLVPAAELAEVSRVRAERETASRAQQPERYAELVEQERGLLEQAASSAAARRDALLAEVRGRLGLLTDE